MLLKYLISIDFAAKIESAENPKLPGITLRIKSSFATLKNPPPKWPASYKFLYREVTKIQASNKFLVHERKISVNGGSIIFTGNKQAPIHRHRHNGKHYSV